MSFELPRRVFIPAHVLARKVGSETFLLDLQRRRCIRLDAAVSRLWELLTSTHDLTKTIILFQSECTVDPEFLEEECCRTIQSLLEQELLDASLIEEEKEYIQ